MTLRSVTAAIAAVTLTLVALSSCLSTDKPMGLFKSLPADGWAYGDTLSFDRIGTDSVDTGRLVIAVRHTDAYLYSNLWLEIATPMPGDSMRIDTVNVQLADIYGKWHGRGTGVSFIATDTLDATFRVEYDRPVKVRHIMRVDTLTDIEQIGLLLI